MRVLIYPLLRWSHTVLFGLCNVQCMCIDSLVFYLHWFIMCSFFCQLLSYCTHQGCCTKLFAKTDKLQKDKWTNGVWLVASFSLGVTGDSIFTLSHWAHAVPVNRESGKCGLFLSEREMKSPFCTIGRSPVDNREGLNVNACQENWRRNQSGKMSFLL